MQQIPAVNAKFVKVSLNNCPEEGFSLNNRLYSGVLASAARSVHSLNTLLRDLTFLINYVRNLKHIQGCEYLTRARYMRYVVTVALPLCSLRLLTIP